MGIPNFLNGNFKKSMGMVTGSRQKGINIVKLKPDPSNPDTKAQQEVREKFKILSQLFSYFTNYLDKYYITTKPNTSAYNEIIALNKNANCIKAQEEGEKGILISKGTLPPMYITPTEEAEEQSEKLGVYYLSENEILVPLYGYKVRIPMNKTEKETRALLVFVIYGDGVFYATQIHKDVDVSWYEIDKKIITYNNTQEEIFPDHIVIKTIPYKEYNNIAIFMIHQVKENGRWRTSTSKILPATLGKTEYETYPYILKTLNTFRKFNVDNPNNWGDAIYSPPEYFEPLEIAKYEINTVCDGIESEFEHMCFNTENEDAPPFTLPNTEGKLITSFNFNWEVKERFNDTTPYKQLLIDINTENKILNIPLCLVIDVTSAARYGYGTRTLNINTDILNDNETSIIGVPFITTQNGIIPSTNLKAENMLEKLMWFAQGFAANKGFNPNVTSLYKMFRLNETHDIYYQDLSLTYVMQKFMSMSNPLSKQTWSDSYSINMWGNRSQAESALNKYVVISMMGFSESKYEITNNNKNKLRSLCELFTNYIIPYQDYTGTKGSEEWVQFGSPYERHAIRALSTDNDDGNKTVYHANINLSEIPDSASEYTYLYKAKLLNSQGKNNVTENFYVSGFTACIKTLQTGCDVFYSDETDIQYIQRKPIIASAFTGKEVMEKNIDINLPSKNTINLLTNPFSNWVRYAIYWQEDANGRCYNISNILLSLTVTR